jgi:GT2 family glycosyltransferase
VLWLNADDTVLPGALAAATSAFQADPDLAFAYGDFEMIDGSGSILRRYRSGPYSWRRVFRRGCYIFSGSLFFRRRLLLAVGGFDPTLRACMDLDLLLRLDGAGKSLHLGRTIAQFRIHGAGKSSRIGTTFVREAFRVRLRYAGRSPILWAQSIWVGLVSALMQVTSPLRYSSRWPRHGGGKTL